MTDWKTLGLMVWDWILYLFCPSGVTQPWKFISLAQASRFLICYVSEWAGQERIAVVLSSLHILAFGQGRVRRHSLMVEGCLDLGGFALQGGGEQWGWTDALCQGHIGYIYSLAIFIHAYQPQVAILILGLKMFVSDTQTWNWPINLNQHVAN